LNIYIPLEFCFLLYSFLAASIQHIKNRCCTTIVTLFPFLPLGCYLMRNLTLKSNSFVIAPAFITYSSKKDREQEQQMDLPHNGFSRFYVDILFKQIVTSYYFTFYLVPFIVFSISLLIMIAAVLYEVVVKIKISVINFLVGALVESLTLVIFFF
jgi:hypothetical protein